MSSTVSREDHDGGTYSLAELREDLAHAGFGEPTLVRGEREMDSVLRARRR